MEQMLSYALMRNLSCMEIDVSDEHWGTMILFMGDLLKEDVNLSEFTTMLGEDYSYLLNDLEGVKKVIATGRPMFQRYDSPKNGNYYYVYISPVLDQDGVRAVQLLVYDWSDFHSNVIKKVLWIVGISALVLALSAVLLLYFINRSAIRPLGKVQKGVYGDQGQPEGL